MSELSKIRTCIWFESGALEAARFYVSLFPNSHIRDAGKFEHMLTGEKDGVHVIEITLAGTPFQLLQAGPHQELNDMMSISVLTEDQAETDQLWEALTASGGKEVQCGWLKDRWGVAWQIVPRALETLLGSGDAARIEAVLSAMRPMKRLDIAALEAAFSAG